jgi:hypothetical protein
MSADFYRAGNLEQNYGSETYSGDNDCQNMSDYMNNQVTSIMVFNDN